MFLVCVLAGFGAPLTPRTQLGNFVWNDLNRDHLQSSGEPGLVGVQVRLLPASGTTPLATTLTDASGLYTFTSRDANLVPGTTYRIVVPLNDAVLTADQLSLVTPNTGSDDSSDSDAMESAGLAVITHQAGAYGSTDNTLDFGFVEPAPTGNVIGDRLFIDLDADGCQDVGEPGIGGVEVRLLLPNGQQVATTTTVRTAGAGQKKKKSSGVSLFALW